MISLEHIRALLQLAKRAAMSDVERLWLSAFEAELEKSARDVREQQAAKEAQHAEQGLPAADTQ